MIRTRRAPLFIVPLTVVAQGLVLWTGFALGTDWMRALARATGGWVNPNLPGAAVLFALSVVPFVFVWARLRPRDIGLEAGKVCAAAAVVGLLWLGTEAGLAAAAAVARTTGPGMAAVRTGGGEREVSEALGFLMAMLVAMPVLEEATYRGFVLPQLWLRIRGGPRVRFWGAVAGSSLLFALVHIPNRWFLRGLAGPEMATSLAAVFLGGIFYAAVYLRTANLWVAGGVHALMNAPTPLVHPILRPQIVMVPLILVLLVVWPTLPWGGRRSVLSGAAVEVVG